MKIGLVWLVRAKRKKKETKLQRLLSHIDISECTPNRMPGANLGIVRLSLLILRHGSFVGAGKPTM